MKSKNWDKQVEHTGFVEGEPFDEDLPKDPGDEWFVIRISSGEEKRAQVRKDVWVTDRGLILPIEKVACWKLEQAIWLESKVARACERLEEVLSSKDTSLVGQVLKQLTKEPLSELDEKPFQRTSARECIWWCTGTQELTTQVVETLEFKTAWAGKILEIQEKLESWIRQSELKKELEALSIVTFESSNSGDPMVSPTNSPTRLRCFVDRSSKFRPQVGETWFVRVVGQNPKGTVSFVECVVKQEIWWRYHKDDKVQEIGVTSEVVANHGLVKGLYGKSPALDERKVAKIQKAGCPEEIISQVKTWLEQHLAKKAWKKDLADREKKSLIEATEEAKNLVPNLQDGQVVAILPLERPLPTQQVSKAQDVFIDDWDKVIPSLAESGRNTHYFWTVVDESFIDNVIGGESGSSYMRLNFATPINSYRDNSLRRVFLPHLDCGDRSPHRGGRFAMVGKNPNNPEFRNFD